MSQISNLLPRMIQDGQLDQDLGAFHDDELRLGLMMMIDNLERYEETMGLVEFTSRYWRLPRQDVAAQDHDWAREQRHWAETEATERRAEAPWQDYQCSSADGKTVAIGELDRPGLERELRVMWRHLQRAHEASVKMAQIMDKSMAGHWLAPEGEVSSSQDNGKRARRAP